MQVRALEQFHLGAIVHSTVDAAEAQLFAAPTPNRRGVLIACNHASQLIYIHNASGVLSSLFLYVIGKGAIGIQPTVFLPWGDREAVYIIGSGATTGYTAAEVIG